MEKDLSTYMEMGKVSKPNGMRRACILHKHTKKIFHTISVKVFNMIWERHMT
jgi:hypothetical protein